MEIIDNFLDRYEFDLLREQLESDVFPWYFGRKVNHLAQIFDPELIVKEKYNWHLFNLMYSNGAPMTPEYDMVLGLINKIKPRALIRVKANMVPVTDSIREFEMHTDLGEFKSDTYDGATTAIFYLNDNNGYTEFEDGTKIDSVSNRLVRFPQNTAHRGTSCTDEPNRVVLNINYF